MIDCAAWPSLVTAVAQVVVRAADHARARCAARTRRHLRREPFAGHPGRLRLRHLGSDLPRLAGAGGLPAAARPGRSRGAPAYGVVAGRGVHRQHHLGADLRHPDHLALPGRHRGPGGLPGHRDRSVQPLRASRDRRRAAAAPAPGDLYLGWATLASAAGFGTTFRSLGMPERAGWTTGVALALVLCGHDRLGGRGRPAERRRRLRLHRVLGPGRRRVATYVDPVRIASVLAIVVVLTFLIIRTVRSPRAGDVLLG